MNITVLSFMSMIDEMLRTSMIVKCRVGYWDCAALGWRFECRLSIISDFSKRLRSTAIVSVIASEITMHNIDETL